MNKKSKFLITSFFVITTFFILQIIYLQNFKAYSKEDIEKKNSFVKITNLPDLSISTEAMYIRHRTLSDIFSIFKESPELREYFPTTFVYNNSNILNITPSKIIHEKKN